MKLNTIIKEQARSKWEESVVGLKERERKRESESTFTCSSIRLSSFVRRVLRALIPDPLVTSEGGEPLIHKSAAKWFISERGPPADRTPPIKTTKRLANCARPT